MAFTRGTPAPAYTSTAPRHVNTPGALVTRPTGAFNSNKNIVAVMPTARPNSSPAPDGAPYYLSGGDRPNGALLRGGTIGISPSKPRVETDLTDPTSWQRQYRFT
jgi:hypothetical protein